MSRAEHTVKNREPWLNDSQWLGDEATHNTGVWQREIVDVQSGHTQRGMCPGIGDPRKRTFEKHRPCFSNVFIKTFRKH